MVLHDACVGACFCVVLPSMCLDDIKLGLGSCVVPFWERAANSVNSLFSLYYVYLLSVLFLIFIFHIC